MIMTFSELIQPLNATLQGDDVAFKRISIDTRTLQPGDVFLAYPGDRFDGHDFIQNAFDSGAVGAIVSHPVKTDKSQLCVKNTFEALTQLASLWREHFHHPVIGLTGSCGKTTTKMLIDTILAEVAPTLATQGTLNNEIGVPLTLLQLQPQHLFAVIEMGANHQGEINRLTNLAKPTIATITNVHPVHIEGFGSLEGVFHAKTEIFNGLPEDGILILNADDAFYPRWQALYADRHTITVSMHDKTADLFADHCHLNDDDQACFTLHIKRQCVDVCLKLLGEHNIANALMAAACAYAAGIDIQTIATGLMKAVPVNQRLEKKRTDNGALILDDSYNANPTSVKAGLRILMRNPGKHICVLGEMLELGQHAEKIHADMGDFCRDIGIDYLLTVGELTRHTVACFGKNGQYFTDRDALANTLCKLITPQTSVLVKGSKRNRMWEFVNALLQRSPIS